MQLGTLIWSAVALVVIAGPLWLGLTGLLRSRASQNASPDFTARSNSRLIISSALLYTLAYNLTFFIQELFLVLPKALTPGLRPTLFHNNHSWVGEHPLASLLQGTGALAIFVTGLVCAVLLRRSGSRSSMSRLFLIWMAYNGFFQSLPQVVIGAVSPGGDVGMAMDYLRMSPTGKALAALATLAVIPPIALWLTRRLLGLAADPAHIASSQARIRFIFFVGTLPASLSILLIVPFRVPRELIEVVLPPVLSTFIGITWMQAGAWREAGAMHYSGSKAMSVLQPLAAVVFLLFVFQLLLRPGVPFY